MLRWCYFILPALIGCLLTQSSLLALPVQEELKLGPAQSLPRQLLTFNTDMLTAIAFKDIGYDSPVFENAIRSLKPQGLRFPGGTIANNYLWQVDSFSEPSDDKTGWAAEQLNLFRKIGKPYDLPGLVRVAKRNQLSVIWVLNVYQESPESTVDLFEKLEQMGLSVSAVEMGNEPYWDGRSLADVQAYIRYAKPLAERLREQRPDIKIGACFAPLGNPANYEEIWNAPLAKETWFDAMVFHEYYGGQGFALEAGQAMPLQAMLHPEALVDQAVDELGKVMPGRPIWFTEWNVGSAGLTQWKNTGAELLFIATAFVRFVEQRDSIDIACFHALHDANFGAFYIDDKTGASVNNASFALFRLLGQAMHQADQVRSIHFGDDDLRGFAIHNPDHMRLLLINRSSGSREITLPNSIDGDYVGWTIDCPPEQKLREVPALIESLLLGKPTLTLPAYSINLVAPQRLLQRAAASGLDVNLFPRRPDLLWWYPPYAAQQPRFDADGIYTVDLAAIPEKDMAVLKMELASSRLSAGQEYLLEFESMSAGDGGLIINFPQANEKAETYTQLTDVFIARRYAFTFDPSQNKGEVTFVFTKDMISQGNKVSFRNFSLIPVE